jgi:hypothetical protein
MPEIWSGEYWTKKGDVSLYIYRKQLSAAPKDGRPRMWLMNRFDVFEPLRGSFVAMLRKRQLAAVRPRPAASGSR